MASISIHKGRRILVTGAGGALGAALLGHLQNQGWWVRALVLPNTVPELAGANETCQGDVCEPSSLQSALTGVDVVLHMAGLILSRDANILQLVNTQGTCNMLTACAQAGIRRFVYVSSTSVEYPKRNAYAQSKWDAEQAVRASNLDWTIVRPTLLVGKGGGAEYNMFAKLVRWPLVALPAGGYARKRPVHVQDLAVGLVALLPNPATISNTYSLAGCEVISLRRMLAELAYANQRPYPLVIPIPTWFLVPWAKLLDHFPLRFSASQALMGLGEDAVPSIDDAVRDFGFAPKSVQGRWNE